MAQANMIYHPSLESCVREAKQAFAATHSFNLSFIVNFGQGTVTLPYASEVIGFALSEGLVPPPLVLTRNPLCDQEFDPLAEFCDSRGRKLVPEYDEFLPELQPRSASCPPLGRSDPASDSDFHPDSNSDFHPDSDSDSDLGLDSKALQQRFIDTMSAPSRMRRMLNMSPVDGPDIILPAVMMLGFAGIYKSELDGMDMHNTLRMDQLPLVEVVVPAPPYNAEGFRAYALSQGLDPAQLAIHEENLINDPIVYSIDPAKILNFTRMLYQNPFPDDIDELDVMAHVISQLKQVTELAEQSLRVFTNTMQSGQLRFLMATTLRSFDLLTHNFGNMNGPMWESQRRSFTGIPYPEPVPEHSDGMVMPWVGYIHERMKRAILLEWVLVIKVLLERLEEKVFYEIQRLECAGKKILVWNIQSIGQVADILAQNNGIDCDEWTPTCSFSGTSTSTESETESDGTFRTPSDSQSPVSDRAYMETLHEEDDC